MGIDRLVFIVIAFLIGETLLLLIINRAYQGLVERGILPPARLLKGLLLLAALLLPLIFAAVSLSGAVYMMSLPGQGLEEIGQVSRTSPAPTETAAFHPATSSPAVEDTDSPLPSTGASDGAGDGPAGKIVYVCQIFEDTATDQICLLRFPDMTIQRMTGNDRGDYNYPSLAPDGQSIIFTGKQDTHNYVIYELSLEGDMRQVSQQPGQAVSPEISPDGRLIVYTYNDNQHNEIWVMERDGSNPRRVFGHPQGDGWDPSWSPDGSRILFMSNQDGTNQLYTIELDGRGLTQLTRLSGLVGRSDWSPDSAAIATYSGPEWNREIYLMNADGTEARPITEGGNNLAPSFSPDGEWIAFTSYRDNYREILGCEIYIMRIDGSEITRLTMNDICDWQPRWGP